MIQDLQTIDDPRDTIHRTVQVLTEGGIVGLPSETVYGLVANSLNESSVRDLAAWSAAAWSSWMPCDDGTACFADGRVALSLRSCQTADDFLVQTVADMDDPAVRARVTLHSLTRRLCERCFPGPLTIIAPASDHASAISRLPNTVRQWIGGHSDQPEVAFRVADQRILSHVHRYMAAPLVWAELPDQHGEAITTAKSLENRLSMLAEASDTLAPVSLILDDGVSRYGGWGTSVRVNAHTWSIRRDGVIQRAAMKQFVKPVIAVVCTGNTCRSPMAETLLRDILQTQFGREDIARVVSAGVAAGRGGGASPQAVEVMGQMGLDLTGHSSQPLDEELVSMSDLILTMTRRHRDAILAAYPDRADRVFTVRRDGGDITDPVGLPVEVYRQCADQLRTELSKWVGELGEEFFPQEVTDGDQECHNEPGE